MITFALKGERSRLFRLANINFEDRGEEEDCTKSSR